MSVKSCPANMNATVYARLTEDMNIPTTCKNLVIDACSNLNDDDKVREAFDDFCKNRQKVGPEISFNSSESLGHIRLLDDVARHISRTTSARLLNEDKIKEHFKSLSNPEATVSQKEEAEDWFIELCEFTQNGTKLAISSPTCWLFRSERTSNAMDEYSQGARCLPCRLGLPRLLPEYVELDFVGFTIDCTNLNNARTPTVFDAEYNSAKMIWITGGKTQPLPNGPSGCIAQGGLLEVVANAPYYENVNKSVLVFTNQV